MKCTIDLPDTLAQQLKQYLQDHPHLIRYELMKCCTMSHLANSD